MKKLLYIANIRLPTEKAHGLQIMKTCEALAEQGIVVELIIPRRLNQFKDDPFTFYKVKKNFTITRRWCWDLISLKIFGALGFWLESWTFYQSVKKYIPHGAVYYTRDLPVAYWLSEKTIPWYYEVHTLPDRPSRYHRLAWQQATGLIVISMGLKIALLKQGIGADKILLAPDAVDLDQFQVAETQADCREKLGLPMKQKIVLYTGHLYEWKGAETLAKAAKFMFADVQVYIVGGTAVDVKRFKQNFSLPNLHIVGWRPHAEIPLWLKAADVLVVPTSAKTKIGSLYTSPLKLFEYMIVQRPIVAADISSIREILNESTATFFEPDNHHALANAIHTVLTNPADAEIQAQRAQEEARRKYSWINRAHQIKQFIFKP